MIKHFIIVALRSKLMQRWLMVMQVHIKKYNFFIFEVVKAHVARRPKYPQTLHYTGDGVFMVSGKIISRRSQFRPEML